MVQLMMRNQACSFLPIIIQENLWGNQLKDTDPSFFQVTLSEKQPAALSTKMNTTILMKRLIQLTRFRLTVPGRCSAEAILDTIPNSIVINDIAMNPDGSTLYMIGEVNGGGRELISWNVATETFYTMSITITSGAQIAYGSDGILYAIAPIAPGGSHSLTYTLDPSSGTLTEIEDDVIIIDDPFSDISSGPIM